VDEVCGGAVLVVEDDAKCRALVVTLLRQAGFTTVEASTGEEAVTLARRQRPKLVVLDLELPGLSGYEITRELRDEFANDLAIVILSGARTESLDVAAGLGVGADDYIVKPFSPDEFLARVRLQTKRVDSTRPVPSDLTRRELQVLNLLAEGQSQKQIADELVISAKTVAGHIQQILAKLGVHSRAQAVAHAYRHALLTGSAARAG
jgi:two-component system, OmpR family, alkaline phosphatase synthesis response regulator PhoP